MKDRKKPALALAALLLVALLAAGLVSSCGNTRANARPKIYPVAGVVIEAPGHFDTWPDGHDCWIPGTPGAAILYGDSIRNPTGGGLVMVFSAGGTLRAGEMSELKVTKGTGAAPLVQVERGQVWLDGAKETAVRTSSAQVAPVKPEADSPPAIYGVEVIPGGASTVTAVGGEVKVEAAGASVTLQEGDATTCEQGKPPSKAVKATASAPVGGLAFLVRQQAVTYFRNEATRSQTEDDARSRLAVDPNDAWANVNLGRALIDAGRTAEAKEKFTRALEINQGFSQALAGLGRAAIEEGRWREAARLYEQARLADKTSLEARLGSANAALGMGNLGEAEKWYKATLDLDSQSQLALAGIGAVNMLRGDLVKAVDDLGKALKIQSTLTAALVAKSYVSALKGDLTSSLASLEKAAEAHPDDFGVKASIADRELRMGRREEALSAFKRLSESKDPAMMAAGYQGMGAVAQLSGDLKNAIAYWTKAQDLAPDRPAVLEDLGQAHLLAGEVEAAVAALSRATAVDINDWRGHELLARALLAAGANSTAVTEGQAAVKLAPDQWSAHVVLGLALEACGAKAEGAVELSRGIALKPKDSLSAAEHVLLAEALEKDGKIEDALAEYRGAQSLSPKEGAYYRLAGDMLTSLGREQDALSQYRKAVELDPADTLSKVRLATALYASGKKNDAIEMLQSAVEHDPNNALPRQLLGEYLLADSDVDGALFQLDAAVKTPGVQPALLASILVTRGNAMDRKEDFAAAIADYSRAISTDPGRGDAWYYLAGDLERTGKPLDAKTAYSNAATLCKDNPAWKKYYDESVAKVNQLR
ncbi:MAG: tetratricopeptide repeat protein [Candidatus Geothermincolia bacterium]